MRWGIILICISSFMLLLGCQSPETTISQEQVDINLNMDDFKDFYWSNYFFSGDGQSIYETFSEDELLQVYNSIFTTLVNRYETLDSDCVNKQETYECLFLYALINEREDLCEYFPEERNFTFCPKNTCQDLIIPYRSLCEGHIKLFTRYSQARNKVEFCKTTDRIPYFCLTYTALEQNSERICYELDESQGRESCILKVRNN